MMDPTFLSIPSHYLTRVNALLQDGQRKILGLVGAPGAGKSTLAAALYQAFPEVSQVVPMDGFHLANMELERLGRSARKGAPDTFDSAGYVNLLRRLRQQGRDEVIYAPEFRREIEEPIAGAISISPQTQLLITEGNYLLLDHGHWADIRPLLDDIWFVDIDETVRNERLALRHQQFGRDAITARNWIESTDEPNARLVAASRQRASVIFNSGAQA